MTYSAEQINDKQNIDMTVIINTCRCLHPCVVVNVPVDVWAGEVIKAFVDLCSIDERADVVIDTLTGV